MHGEIYKARISELRSMFLATGSILHNGEKGSLRESFLINLISKFLPEVFGIGSGLVVDAFGGQSVQADIIIYDKRSMPPILEAAGRGIYPVDSVLRVIEVKSNVRKESLDQFSKMIECFDPNNPKGLKVASYGKLGGGQTYYPLCAMFGFESGYKGFADECFRNPIIRNSQSLICLDGIGLWTHDQKFGEKIKLAHDGRYLTFADDTQPIRFFMGLLFDQLDATARSRSGYKPLQWLI
ncbi:hypothetical protein JYG36_13505 [Pseudomonas sp. SORT22]|uniref:DUF6602 domain-containing protein n=1 Tax=Pseudomonas sp. SORT22 TaxID=2813842 RepID=UPI001BD1106C|nr:DUF6602 domain-containing protein [Pseudomonas sp. SORT22]QVM94143.1 hypothetical protein JYG36_13505 [Pseudomonas sp. SORT22]